MSLSLSDLIYGSKSQSQSQEQATQDHSFSDSPNPSSIRRASNKSTPRAVKQDPAVDHYYNSPFTSSQSQSQSQSQSRDSSQPQKKKVKYDFESNNEDRLFFGVKLAPTVINTVGRRLRCKRKKIYDGTAGRYIMIDDETAEQRANRFGRMEEKKKQWERRVKNPKWNFRSELDVGAAMEHSIEKSIGEEQEKLMKDKKGKKGKKVKKEEEDDDHVWGEDDHIWSDDDDDDDDDASEPGDGMEQSQSQAQSQTQSQLDSMLKRAKTSQKPTTMYSDPTENPSHPLHYLWLGHCVPQWVDVKHNYMTLLAKMKPHIRPKNSRGLLTTRDESNIVLKVLIESVTRKLPKGKFCEGKMTQHLCNDTNAMYKRNIIAILPLLVLGYTDAERRNCPKKLYSKRKDYLRRKEICGASFDPVHEKAKKVQSIVARYIVGCAGVLPYMPKEMMTQMLDLLHTTDNTTDSARTIIRQSQTLANNWVLWNEIHPIMKKLRTKGFLAYQDYQCMREELLSSDSEFFTDPWLTTNKYDYYERSLVRRKYIYDYVENLRKDHLEGAKKRKRAERDELDSDEEIITVVKKRRGGHIDLPWNLKISEKLAKNVPWDQMPHTERNEKYSQVVHNASTSVATIHFTLSFLFSLMSHQRAPLFKSASGNSDILLKIHEEIELFLSKLSGNVWRNSIGLPKPYEKVVLSAPLAYVTLMTQSYIANSGMYGSSKKVKQEDGYVSSDNFDSESIISDITNNKMLKEPSLDFNDIANALSARGQLQLRDKKLRIFHRIHLTTGVSILAKCFGSRCAEILARPCFTGGVVQDTPFDLVRLALEDAEKNGNIQRNAAMINYGSHAINAEDLIREFENAAEVFCDILITAPTNFDCQCWHAAARIGSALVASGIDIGKGARIACPHQYSMEDLDQNLCGGSFSRSRHTRYNELRAAASEAVQTLLKFAKETSHGGHRYHYAVKTLLEWKEAIGLLAMRPHISKNSFQYIRELHAFHTMAWASEERSEDSLKHVILLAQSGLLSSNHAISLLARIIEKDPNNSISWLALSSMLPLKHGNALLKLRSKSYWWASEAVSTWKSNFFATPLTFDPKESKNPSSEIENLTAAKNYLANNDSPQSNDEVSRQWSRLKHKFKFKSIGKDWLWPTAPSDEDEEDHLDMINGDGTIRMFDQELPRDCRETEIEFDLVLKILVGNGDSEVIAAKALVAHHIYGSCNYINHAVYFLTRQVKSADKNCIESKLLTWLSQMNVDVIGSLDALISILKKKRSHKSEAHSPIRFKFASF